MRNLFHMLVRHFSHVSDSLSFSEDALSESSFRSWSKPSDNEMFDIISRSPLIRTPVLGKQLLGRCFRGWRRGF